MQISKTKKTEQLKKNLNSNQLKIMLFKIKHKTKKTELHSEFTF